LAERRNKVASVLIELTVANALASQLFDRELARIGVAPAQVGVLTLVAIHGPSTPTRLEYESGLPPTTLRERLQALETAGYVRRLPNPADGRSHFVGITASGKAFLRRTSSALERVERALSDALGEPLEAYRPPLERLRLAGQSLLTRDEVPFGKEGPDTDVVFR
jgi:DNA-binding MarR family transcriptional regulator